MKIGSIFILKLNSYVWRIKELSDLIVLKAFLVFFFTRTSLPKSSNNLEPICNYVNVKCSRLVILGNMYVTCPFTGRETFAVVQQR